MNGYADLTTNIENSRNCLRRIARHDDQEFSNQSILNAMEKFVKTVNAMDETILVPCRLMDRKVGDSTDILPVEQKQHSHHVKKTSKASVRDALNTSDLFRLYNMLNMVKVDLLWGRQDVEETPEPSSIAASSVDQTDKSDVRYNKQKSASPAPTQPQPPVSSSSSEQSQTLGAATSNSSSSSTSPSSSCSSTASESGSSIKGHIRRPSTVSMTSTNSVSTLSDSESEISAENDSGIESESSADQDKSTELAKQFRTHLHGLYRSLEQMTEAANYLTARYQSDVGPV